MSPQICKTKLTSKTLHHILRTFHAWLGCMSSVYDKSAIPLGSIIKIYRQKTVAVLTKFENKNIFPAVYTALLLIETSIPWCHNVCIGRAHRMWHVLLFWLYWECIKSIFRPVLQQFLKSGSQPNHGEFEFDLYSPHFSGSHLAGNMNEPAACPVSCKCPAI